MSAFCTARNPSASGMWGSSDTGYDGRMARIALAMGPGGHPADLGPCARPHVEPALVRAALLEAGHLLDEGDADLAVVDVACEQPPDSHRLVLVSFDRPLDPWRAIADAAERQAFIEPWAADLERRKHAALARRASAYADSIEDLLAAIELALADDRPEPPALHYLGALFDHCPLRPGSRFELDSEARPLVLGRGTSADVHVPSRHLARAHLQLAVTADGLVEVTDLAGTNGTWLSTADVEQVALVPGASVVAPPGALLMPDGAFRFLVA